MSVISNKMHTQEYVYDFSEDGGVQGSIDLSAKASRDVMPVGAVIKSVRTKVLTAFTSGGSATLEYGNGDDANGYSGAAIAVAALTANTLRNGWDNAAALLWDDTNDHMLEVDVADSSAGQMLLTINTADMTAGKMVVYVDYYLPEETA